MIHNIIHISDIHIRTGDSKKSRYDEYITVFNNLCESISQQKSIIDKTAIIVITGDVFHDKNKIGPSGIKIATYLLQKLSVLANVFVIRGNHDYRQDNPNEMDLVSALMSYDIPNVTYLDTTGIHTFQNISFGLTAIQETLLYGATSGITNQLPEFPVIPSTPNYKIALFHGTINGCTLQNGLATTRNGYPIDWFQGYDAILLGDIHLQQIRRANIIDNTNCNLPYTSICQTYNYSNQIPWGYSGSLLQQDFGETLKGHGYVLWNLQDKLINVYHIKNTYGMVKLYYNGDINEIMVEHKQYIKPITKLAPLDKIITLKWFPDILKVRIYGENITSDILDNISNKIISYGKSILSITTKVPPKDISLSESSESIDSSNDIQNINSIDSLIQFIESKLTTDTKYLYSNKWKNWLLHPESIKYSSQYIPDTVSIKLNKKIDNIDKAILDFTNEFEKIQTIQSVTGNLSLNKLEWSWILNYKDNNVFDFDNNIKNISIINAKNGNGKSNFLEIICIALFGEGFPSRHNTKYSSTIICNKKPDGVMASTQITFTLNSTKYCIIRTIRNNAIKRNIKFEDVILYKYNEETREIIHQKDNAVTKWVEEYIGEASSYQMSSILTQNADNDFFSLDNSKQKELLDNVLSLNHINSLKKLLKESTSYYKNSIELVESYTDGIKSNTKVIDQKYIDELQKYKLELTNIQSDKTKLFTKWNTISQYELSKYSDITQLEYKLNPLQTTLKTLPVYNSTTISKYLSNLETNIQKYTNDKSKFHQFTDLSNGNHLIPADYNNETTKHIISQNLLTLQQHPFFKDKKYNIYDDITQIDKLIDDNFENDEDASELVKIIYDYKTWNKIHTEKFGDQIKYFQDESEIHNLQNKITSLISDINVYPEKILNITKKIDKMRRQLTKLTKEKDLLVDKKPNRSTKTNDWFKNIKETVLKYGTINDYEHTKEFITNSIQQIPIICTNIVSCSQKIREYSEYIKDCENYPYNPDCNACKLQPWRTKYDSYSTELPILKSQFDKFNEELSMLKYEDIDIELHYTSYKNYINKLNECLKGITQQINDIQTYNLEKEIIKEWNSWSEQYDILKNKYDILTSEIANIESEKKQLEITFEKIRNEKGRIQMRIELIQTKKQEYEKYISEKDSREKDYQFAFNKLTYIWYFTLYTYRVNIIWYIQYVQNNLDNLKKEKQEYLDKLKIANERDRIISMIDELEKVYRVYHYWISWKDLDESEKSLINNIKELELVVKGYTNGSYNKELLECVNLIEMLKNDYNDLVYISEAFDGYREWLYTANIGPIIQKRVNEILDMICDERPLALECEWLDVIDTLSWFVRDCGSKVIIQKASGYQRFIIGIAMRVAINQIGLSKMRFSELFIDEGFTSCDIDNLERVPEFLRGLLKYYGSIYLATHLEDLKLCADKHIYIKRDDNGLSQIQYGDVEMIKQIEDSNKNKKRGRPTKNSIQITKV
jgi:DNA repair exonuclease SbcCD ATPase subunit